MSIFLRKLRATTGIIRMIKDWPRVFAVRLGLIKSAYISFRNGHRFYFTGDNYGELIGTIDFFADFPDGRIKDDLTYFNYEGKDLIFRFDPAPTGSFLRNEWIDIFKAKDIAGKTILDFGCSVGDTVIQFALRGAERVIGFDILPKRHFVATQNVARNNLQDICQLENVAIGGESGEIEMDSNREYSEHYKELKRLETKEGKIIKIPILTLSEIVKKYNVGNESVIKSDIQGGEYGVFIKTTDDVLRKFSMVAIRYYYLRDQRSMELKKRFESAGFSCEYIKPKKWGCGYLVARKVKEGSVGNDSPVTSLSPLKPDVF